MSELHDIPLRLPVQDFYSKKVRQLVAENAARHETENLIRRNYANGKALANLLEDFPHITRRGILMVFIDNDGRHAGDGLQARIERRIAMDHFDQN